MSNTLSKRGPGRPRKESDGNFINTRQALIKAGLSALTEKGYSYTGIEEILRAANVPKGSFYHYFGSKEAFGEVLIEAYNAYFMRKLSRWFLDDSMSPLQRLQAFVDDAKQGMQKFAFRRGCLVGNLGQEMAALPDGFRVLLQEVFLEWEKRTARLLQEAATVGEISPNLNTQKMARFFWIGWEGAVLRAKLEESAAPLDLFAHTFISLVQHS